MVNLDHPVSDGNTEWIALQLTPKQAREILIRNTLSNMLVMCRGYNDEDDQFTELVCEDDKDLDFEDYISYPEFQLWLQFAMEQPNKGYKL